MLRSRFVLSAAFCALLGACTYKPSFINEYKIDIQQGNVLSQEMVAQLKPGQTRDQVRFLLGSPMITDIFHQQRWDYVYRYQNGQTGNVESRKFAVFFNAEGLLERVGGDVAVAEVAELTVPASRSRLVDLGSLPEDAADKPLPPREEPTYFRRFMNLIGF
jgi:outer membrane protein assembly factor BamE